MVQSNSTEHWISSHPGDDVALVIAASEMSSSSPSSPELPRGGLGSSSHVQVPLSPASSVASSTASSSSSIADCDRSGLPSTFGGGKARKRRRKAQPNPSQSAFPRDDQKSVQPGAWEKHTRGIGSKLMAKYGFKGRLGAREDGIAAPIEQVLRPAKLGLGAGSFKEKSAVVEVEADVQERNIATEMQSSAGMQSEENRWRKKGAGSKKRPRTQQEPLIFDMRTGEPRRVDNIAEAVASVSVCAERKEAEKGPDGVFAAPEVLYNLRMLRDKARVQLDNAKHRRATEELILQTAKAKARNLQTELDELRKAMIEATQLEEELYLLQKRVLEDADQDVTENDEFGDVVNRFAIVIKRAKKIESMSSNNFVIALREIVCAAVQRRFAVCLSPSAEKGRSRRKIATHIYNILKLARHALPEEEYIWLCTRTVLVQLRRHISAAAWDAVSGAWVADVVSELSDALPEVVISVFAEEVLVPHLVSRLDNVRSLGFDNQAVDVHLWVHPWLPVVGRKRLGEVIGRVRVLVTKRMEDWDVHDSLVETVEVAGLVGTWEGVLSRRKMQLALARHIIPKLARAVGTFCQGAEVGRYSREECLEHPACFEAVSIWARVSSSRLLANALMRPAFDGLSGWMRDFLFDDCEEEEGEGLWECATRFYQKWKAWFPGKLLPHIREGLAAVLFMIHAGRVVRTPASKALLSGADVRGLLPNRFSPAVDIIPEDPKPERKKMKKAVGRMGVKEILEHIARREGLSVIGGVRGADGAPLLKVGSLHVRIDGRRGVLVLAQGAAGAGKVVGVEEVVRLAKMEVVS